MTKPNATIVHYLIVDTGDGVTTLELFKTPKARDEYIDLADARGNVVTGEGTLRQNDIDEAMSLADVRAAATEEDDPPEDSDDGSFYAAEAKALWPFPTGTRP